tara:strand:- start:5696 stop:6421 length:726 start_codon:yes stop_codon:yes gene_type:complete
MNRNLKLIFGIIYILCLGILLFILFSYLDLKDLTSYSYLKSQSEILTGLKDKKLILFIILFFLFSVIWILLLGFASPIAILSGFIFGPWLGTVVSVLSFTAGCTLLYIIAKIFFEEIIVQNLEKRIEKFKNFFNKNELFYFMMFRFTGGFGIPFAIQNLIPVLFNMKVKNYFYATLFGLVPTIFIINSLGSGIEKYIDDNDTLKIADVILEPSIYWPLIGFIIILIISFFAKQKFFRNEKN